MKKEITEIHTENIQVQLLPALVQIPQVDALKGLIAVDALAGVVRRAAGDDVARLHHVGVLRAVVHRQLAAVQADVHHAACKRKTSDTPLADKIMSPPTHPPKSQSPPRTATGRQSAQSRPPSRSAYRPPAADGGPRTRSPR